MEDRKLYRALYLTNRTEDKTDYCLIYAKNPIEATKLWFARYPMPETGKPVALLTRLTELTDDWTLADQFQIVIVWPHTICMPQLRYSGTAAAAVLIAENALKDHALSAAVYCFGHASYSLEVLYKE